MSAKPFPILLLGQNYFKTSEKDIYYVLTFFMSLFKQTCLQENQNIGMFRFLLRHKKYYKCYTELKGILHICHEQMYVGEIKKLK